MRDREQVFPLTDEETSQSLAHSRDPGCEIMNFSPLIIQRLKDRADTCPSATATHTPAAGGRPEDKLPQRRVVGTESGCVIASGTRNALPEPVTHSNPHAVF